MPSSFRSLVLNQRRGRCNAIMFALTPTPMVIPIGVFCGKEKFTGPLTRLMPLHIMLRRVSVRSPLDWKENMGGRIARKAKTTVCSVVVRWTLSNISFRRFFFIWRGRRSFELLWHGWCLGSKSFHDVFPSVGDEKPAPSRTKTFITTKIIFFARLSIFFCKANRWDAHKSFRIFSWRAEP